MKSRTMKFFEAQMFYNKWLKELTYSEQKQIIEMMEEYAHESKKEIIEGLEKMSNEYEIAGGGEYVVMKLTLDHYIENL